MLQAAFAKTLSNGKPMAQFSRKFLLNQWKMSNKPAIAIATPNLNRTFLPTTTSQYKNIHPYVSKNLSIKKAICNQSFIYNLSRPYAPNKLHIVRTLMGKITQADLESYEKEVNSNVPEEQKQIGKWLAIIAGLVFGIVVVGGITRLTESGLSITEWKPVTGTLPPFSSEAWQQEFEKYKQFPEYLRLQPSMTLEEFKSIYYWEWSHRFLGRFIGFAFAAPFAYFAIKRRLTTKQIAYYLGLFSLGGAQGALGWYMVKSGLEVQEGEYPRVSAYRLCAHLGVAFLLYIGCLWGMMNIFRPFVAVKTKIPTYLKFFASLITFMTFSTAMSGAFVAGLDAGMIYNEFPFMGEGFVPENYWGLEPWRRNFTENSASVQFNHRVMAISTFFLINYFWLFTIWSKKFPVPTRMAVRCMAGAAWVQVILGISTLIYQVPVPLAAMHQAGSLALLTTSVWMLHSVVGRVPVKNPKWNQLGLTP